jgi:hypothetical protein
MNYSIKIHCINPPHEGTLSICYGQSIADILPKISDIIGFPAMLLHGRELLADSRYTAEFYPTEFEIVREHWHNRRGILFVKNSGGTASCVEKLPASLIRELAMFM